MNCAICNKPVVTRSQAAIEHIVPLSRGGKNIETNTRMVHISCHRKKRGFWGRLNWRIGYYKWKLIVWLEKVGK